jgi:hypothetical protein
VVIGNSSPSSVMNSLSRRCGAGRVTDHAGEHATLPRCRLGEAAGSHERTSRSPPRPSRVARAPPVSPGWSRLQDPLLVSAPFSRRDPR